MKLAVRAFVLTLVAVGAYASTHSVQNHAAAKLPVNSQMASNFMPVPTCTPINGCGTIGKGGKGLN